MSLDVKWPFLLRPLFRGGEKFAFDLVYKKCVPGPTPTKLQFSIYNPLKTAFLAVAIVPVPFLF